MVLHQVEKLRQISQHMGAKRKSQQGPSEILEPEEEGSFAQEEQGSFAQEDQL